MLHLLRHGTDLDSLEQTLNKRSGLAGLSGLPGDTRVIFPKTREQDRRAVLAMDVFLHRLRAGIGSMLASLGGLDALVFTDVIGETEPIVRQRVCDAFAFLGLRLDDDLNASSATRISLRRIRRCGSSLFRVKRTGRLPRQAVDAWRSEKSS